MHEYGGFMQANRWLWNRRIRLLGSIRYDKSQYMQGRFTPRLATLFFWGKERQNSVRLSYQTGFRFPTLQDQFIALDIGFNEVTLGGTTRARSAFGLDRWAYTPQSVAAYRSAAGTTTDSATLASLAQQHLVRINLPLVRPEFNPKLRNRCPLSPPERPLPGYGVCPGVLYRLYLVPAGGFL